MALPCCDRMAQDLAHACAQHPNRLECPDAFIAKVRSGFGLIVRDGGSSVIEIGFCPWCGSALPGIDDRDLDG